jgi:hypothetical protein
MLVLGFRLAMERVCLDEAEDGHSTPILDLQSSQRRQITCAE